MNAVRVLAGGIIQVKPAFKDTWKKYCLDEGMNTLFGNGCSIRRAFAAQTVLYLDASCLAVFRYVYEAYDNIAKYPSVKISLINIYIFLFSYNVRTEFHRNVQNLNMKMHKNYAIPSSSLFLMLGAISFRYRVREISELNKVLPADTYIIHTRPVRFPFSS